MKHEAHMQRETAIKLALERAIIPKIMSRVWLIASTWKDIALQRASMEAYRQPNLLLKDELRQHYAMVEDRFYDAVTQQIGRELPWQSASIGAAYYHLWAEERAKFNALKISLTIRKRLDNINHRTIVENGDEAPLRAIDRVNEVERIADQQWPGYVANVAVTETQAPAEAYKSFEALAATGALAAMSGPMVQIQNRLNLV